MYDNNDRPKYKYIDVGYTGIWLVDGRTYMGQAGISIKRNMLQYLLDTTSPEDEYIKLRGNVFDNQESKKSENSPDYGGSLSYWEPIDR